MLTVSTHATKIARAMDPCEARYASQNFIGERDFCGIVVEQVVPQLGQRFALESVGRVLFLSYGIATPRALPPEPDPRGFHF